MCIKSIECTDAKFKSIFFNIEQIKSNLFSHETFNISKDSMPHDWATDSECLDELIAIKSGIINFEEWAIKSKFDF